jgi:hypothetical protein
LVADNFRLGTKLLNNGSLFDNELSQLFDLPNSGKVRLTSTIQNQAEVRTLLTDAMALSMTAALTPSNWAAYPDAVPPLGMHHGALWTLAPSTAAINNTAGANKRWIIMIAQ